MTTVLARPLWLSVDSFARTAGIHPELVGRLIRLGLLDATYDAAGTPLLAPGQLARAARIRRLRDSLSVNYAALGLVLDLLDRIDNLEAAQRSRPRSYGGTDRRWTRTA